MLTYLLIAAAPFALALVLALAFGAVLTYLHLFRLFKRAVYAVDVAYAREHHEYRIRLARARVGCRT